MQILNKPIYIRKSSFHSKKASRTFRIKHLLLVVFVICFISFFMKDAIFYFILRNLSLFRTCRPLVPTEFQPSKPKIAIIIAYEKRRFSELGSISEKQKRQYVKKHGYDLIVNTDRCTFERKPSWCKVRHVYENLNDYDWVMWMDSDTLIMNDEVKIEEFLDERYDFILTQDIHGPNAGMWIMKNSKWSVEFLETWWNSTLFVRTPKSRDDVKAPSGDQHALFFLISPRFSELGQRNFEHVKFLPQCSFNSYLWWRKWESIYMWGDFLLHLSGSNKKGLFKDIYEGASWPFFVEKTKKIQV